jgi:hypothetical protein
VGCEREGETGGRREEGEVGDVVRVGLGVGVDRLIGLSDVPVVALAGGWEERDGRLSGMIVEQGGKEDGKKQTYQYKM